MSNVSNIYLYTVILYLYTKITFEKYIQEGELFFQCHREKSFFETPKIGETVHQVRIIKQETITPLH